MHTAEHILNQTMVRMFGCPRSRNAHIERKKSKCDYLLEMAPTEEQVQEIERKVNEVIDRHLEVGYEFVTRGEVPPEVDLWKLPEDASETLRLGPSLAAGEEPFRLVPRGCWQGTRIVGDGDWALLGTTMAPDYEDCDYEDGTDALLEQYPAFAEQLRMLLGEPRSE